MEPTEGTTTPEPTEAPAASGRAGMSEERYAQEAAAQQQQQQQKPPAHAPAPGTKYVLNPKTGLYDVHRVDAEGTEHVEKGEDDLPEELREQDAKKDDAAGEVTLPDILPDYVRDNPEVQILVADAAAAMTKGGEYNTEAVQRVVDLVAQFELEIGTDQPNLHEEDRIRAILRSRWGSYYEGRLEQVQKYVNARPALKAYLNRTGAGNQLSVLEALGMVACGEMSHKPEDAAKLLAAMKSDPKSALRDPYHKGHRLALQQAKVLADVMDRRDKFLEKKNGGRQANVKEMVADRTAKEPAGDSPEAKIDAELKQLRLDPAYLDKSKPNHKVVIERVRELYRARYPD
jgi:hypothetical protein